MPKYGNKTIYIRDWSKWDVAKQIAKSQGLSMSEYLELALDSMLKPNADALKIQQIRRILEQ